MEDGRRKAEEEEHRRKKINDELGGIKKEVQQKKKQEAAEEQESTQIPNWPKAFHHFTIKCQANSSHFRKTLRLEGNWYKKNKTSCIIRRRQEVTITMTTNGPAWQNAENYKIKHESVLAYILHIQHNTAAKHYTAYSLFCLLFVMCILQFLCSIKLRLSRDQRLLLQFSIALHNSTSVVDPLTA